MLSIKSSWDTEGKETVLHRVSLQINGSFYLFVAISVVGKQLEVSVWMSESMQVHFAEGTELTVGPLSDFFVHCVKLLLSSRGLFEHTVNILLRS